MTPSEPAPSEGSGFSPIPSDPSPGPRPLAGATAACFVLGVALMIPFEATVTRVLGMGFLIGFVVCGLFLIADPRFLARGEGVDGSPEPSERESR